MTMPTPEAAMAAAVQATGLDPAWLVSWPVPDKETAEALLLVDLSELVATIEGGEVVGVAEKPCLWLHGAAEGGSTNPQGTRYVRRGETLTFAAAIRIGADPASAVVESDPGTGQPLTQEWGLELRGVSGAMWCPIVAVTNGQASGAVVVPERLPDGDYCLPEELLARIGGYRLRLADPAAWAFKVVG